jgi:hypothetical protein
VIRQKEGKSTMADETENQEAEFAAAPNAAEGSRHCAVKSDG